MSHSKFPIVLAAIALVISAVGCYRERHNLAASRSRTYSVVCADRDILLTDATLADPQHDFQVCPGDRVTWHYPGHQFSVDFSNSPEGDPFGTAGIFVATKGVAQSPPAIERGASNIYKYAITVTDVVPPKTYDPHIIVIGGGRVYGP